MSSAFQTLRIGIYGACLLVVAACGEDPTTNNSPDPSLDFPGPDEPERQPEPGQTDAGGPGDPGQPNPSADAGQPNPGSSLPPCLDLVGPDPIVIGPVAPGESGLGSIQVTNCGDEELAIPRLTLVRHESLPGRDRFVVTEPDTASSYVYLAPGEPLDVTIRYVPAAWEAVDGSTVIVQGLNAAGDNVTLERDVLGQAESLNGCAELVAEGRPSGSNDTWQAELAVPPLTRVELRARDGQADVPAEWEIMVRPEQSATALTTTDDDRREIFADAVGGYALRAFATTQSGEVCVSPPLGLSAEPGGPIYVELTWDTPEDPDQTDSDGSDLDLHVLHPHASGSWNELPWDCMWRNSEPNWGETGSEDNPRLDIDDTNGSGPEVISLQQPEITADIGGPYRVGVHYFSNHGWGESTATVRIFIDGHLRLEASRTFRNREFWEVASFHWPTTQADLIDLLHPGGFPD